MKKIIFTLLLMAGTVAAGFAQSDNAVSWKYSAKKLANNTYEVHLTASIQGGWHLYSQDGGDGPLSTSFKFTKNPLLTLDGKVKEAGTLKKVFEEAFGSEVRYYERTVDFIQVVKVKGKAKTTLAGTTEFMVCNDKECLPPTEVPFKIALQ